MDLGPELGGDRHFAGVTTSFLIEYLRTQMSASAIDELLSCAGERRTAHELADDSSWSSYGEVRRLLEATVEALGDGRRLRELGTADVVSLPEFSTLLQVLGSPAALYRDLGELAAHFSPVTEMVTHEVSATEWLCDQRFKPGFEPYRAFCDFTCGMLGIVPRVFSFPLAEVIEEACQLDGAASCRFRVRWDSTDDADRRAGHFQLRLDIMSARLETLHATVGELVSDESLEVVLSRILASAAKAVTAPAYILVLDDLPTASQRVYAEGVSYEDAVRLADELAHSTTTSDTRRLVVDVASRRRHYGRLAALHREGGHFFAGEESSLQAYARLAAVALDSAAALEDARRQATTARTLLELSSALAEIRTSEEVAAKLVRSVPQIIDCDRAAVILVDPLTSIAHIAATHGYPEAVDAELRAARFPVAPAAHATSLAVSVSASPNPFDLAAWSKELGSAMMISCPIIGNDELIGWLAASVTNEPERLERDPEIEARLRGLTGQAATAILNARLVEEVRHQALHDTLTGLPNRALIHDRVEQMLARARRHGTAPSAIFIDLDGFKEVNDTLGHAAGDQLLCSVATRLEATLRGSDTIGRLGGDEFVVLAEAETMSIHPELAAGRLLAALRAPFCIDGVTINVSASIGIAIGDRPSPGELLRDADIALYQAKAAGKNRYVLYVPSVMQVAARDHARSGSTVST